MVNAASAIAGGLSRHVALLVVACLIGQTTAAKAQEDTWQRAIDFYQAGEVGRAAHEFLSVSAKTDDAELRSQALNNACALFNDVGDFGLSLDPCERAVAARRETASDALPRALNNLAVSLQGSGDPRAAASALNEALTLNRVAQDWDGVAANLTNLATNDQLTGHYARADERFRAALEVCEEHREEPWSTQRRTIAALNRAGLLERLGRFDEGLGVLDGLLAEDALSTPTATTLRATAELNRGVLYRNLGDPYLALESFHSAEKLFRTTGSDGGAASVLLNSALARHHGLGDSQQALKLLDRASQLALISHESSLELEITFTRAQIYLDLGRTGAAREAFERSLQLAEGAASGIGQWSALTGLAQVERALGATDSARTYLNEALQLVEQQASGLDRNRSSTFLTGQRAVYEAAVGVLLAADLGTKPSGATDESVASDAPYLLVQRFKERAMADSLRPLDQPGESPTVRTAADLDQLRTILGDTPLIDYFAVEGRLLAWALSRTSFVTLDLGPTVEIYGRIQAVLQAIAAGEPANRSDLRSLGHTLLDLPLEAIGNGSSAEQLIVAPDGALWQLPFDLLSIDRGERKPHRVLDSLSVREVQSGWTLLYLKERQRFSLKTVFEGWALAQDANRAQGLAPLTHAATEIETAARTLGGSHRLFVDGRATESAFRTQTRPARVRHLATHTRIDDRAGLATRMVLATTEPSASSGAASFDQVSVGSMAPSDTMDGLLSPADIARLSLPADLTVLAACTTSGQPKPNGAGALGTLAGAFMVAGSRSVLATLWEVDDRSSAVFLEQFYGYLSRGAAADRALRATKLRFANDRRWETRPRAWAGWVLIGDTPAVRGQRFPAVWQVLAILAVAFVLYGLSHQARIR